MLYTQTHLPPDQGVVDRFSLNKASNKIDNYDSIFQSMRTLKHEYEKSSSQLIGQIVKTPQKQPKTA